MQIDKGSAHLKKSLLPEAQEKRRFFLEGSLERCKNFLPFLSGLSVGWLTALAVWRIYQYYSAKKGLSLAKWVAYGVKNFFSFPEKHQAEGVPTAKREQEIRDSLWFLEEKLRREFAQKARRDETKNKPMAVKNALQSVSERVGEAFRAEEALSEHAAKSAKPAEKEIEEEKDVAPQAPSLKKSAAAPVKSSKNGTKKAPAKSAAKSPAKKTAKTAKPAETKKPNAGTANASTAKKVSKKTAKNGKSVKKT